jgi:hypothetical protein
VTGALARHYHVAPVSRHVQQHDLGKIAARVEHRAVWPAVRSCVLGWAATVDLPALV